MLTSTIDFPFTPTFNLQGALDYCDGAGGVDLVIADSNTIETMSWGLTDPALDTLFTNSLMAGTYTLNATDLLGLCSADTTFTVVEYLAPSIFNDTTVCNYVHFTTGTISESGGVWSAADPTINFNPSNTVENPDISTSTPGPYIITYTDNTCNIVLTSTIEFPLTPSFNLQGALEYCEGTGGVDLAIGDSSTIETMSWGLSYPALDTLFTNSLMAGTYTLNGVESLGVCSVDTTFIIVEKPAPTVQNNTLGCNLGEQLEGTTSYAGGVWSVADTAVHFQPDSAAENPFVYTTVPGTYTLTFTDNECGIPVTLEIEFPPYAWTEVYDTTLCQGVEYILSATEDPSATSWIWNTGESGSSITVSEPGVYVVTASNACHSMQDTAVIVYKFCDIEAPNIISISSTVGNNTWFVESDGLAFFRCTIVNRWGNVIYEFDDANGSWNGYDMSNKLVPEGTYFYAIDAVLEGGEELQKHGFIQVVH